ncbi:MAG TPA: DNA repair protein RadC [Armatimonadota bacterium]|nr:DNA repair protein RadC [Armatimonadota bacterium]
MSTDQYTLIRDLPTDERPRERLEKYGAATLAIPELLAIILRVGNTRMSAIELGQQLICRFGSLRNLANASVQELSQINGIGLAKACQLKAAFELGKRLATAGDVPRPIINSSITAANLVMEDMRYLQEEHYRVLFLDTRHQVITQRDISIGSLNSSIVHPRETFKAAISHASAAIILVHNHPSGDPKPSPEDITLTARMREAGELIGIPVLDHLIIGDGRFISLKERGLL